MNSLTHRFCFPRNFSNSWHSKKIVALHGRRMGQMCTLTLLAMYDHCAEHAKNGRLSLREAKRMAAPQHSAAKTRVLAAMRQANLLAATEDGFRVLVLTPGQTPGQLSLALESKPDLDPILKTGAQRPKAPKAQQNQPSRLARAGGMSASQPEKTPLIDRASTHTEFLQAPLSERSDATPTPSAQARGLLPLSSKSASEKRRGHGLAGERGRAESTGAADTLLGVGAGKASQPKVASVANPQRLRVVPSEVERSNGSPRELHRGASLPQRVNTQRVKKQQKLVICRESPTSAALAEESLMEKPSLLPTKNSVIAACQRVWPTRPLRPQAAEAIVQQAYTWDEINAELDRAVERNAGKNPIHWPSLLVQLLAESRDRGKSQKETGLRPAVHVHKRNGDNFSQRRKDVDAVNAWLGEERVAHHMLTDPYVDAVAGHSPDAIVSLYAEMNDADPDIGWADVCAAFASGRKPVRTGVMPPLPDLEKVARLRAAIKAHVQFRVDKSSMAG